MRKTRLEIEAEMNSEMTYFCSNASTIKYRAQVLQ